MATNLNAGEAVLELYRDGLRNAHAVEKQALSIMTPQVERLEHYPEVAERLRAHIDETNEQVSRLDEIMAGFDTSRSVAKDLGLSMSGGMAAMSHSMAGDEILKNSYANYAFEHFEIAAYSSLIVLGEDYGFDGVDLLRLSLREERAMAEWIEQMLPTIVRRYAGLYAEHGASTAKA
ncbi:ferritin-like domain-containing protein [Sphingomonas sp. IW22]|uniref:ferritin-like domain-containing protein n=1 Tax=Sphingomonas sp. IW22 TaxID=3242489 RepID=UPI00352106BB